MDQLEVLLKEEKMEESPFRGKDMEGKKSEVESVVENHNDGANMEGSGRHTEVQTETIKEFQKA